MPQSQAKEAAMAQVVFRAPWKCANAECEKLVTRDFGERMGSWLRRATCSIECRVALAIRGEDWQRVFPGARYRGLKEAPVVCPHCLGVLFGIDTGLQCRSCAREWVIAECLLATLYRQHEGVALGRNGHHVLSNPGGARA